MLAGKITKNWQKVKDLPSPILKTSVSFKFKTKIILLLQGCKSVIIKHTTLVETNVRPLNSLERREFKEHSNIFLKKKKNGCGEKVHQPLPPPLCSLHVSLPSGLVQANCAHPAMTNLLNSLFYLCLNLFNLSYLFHFSFCF